MSLLTVSFVTVDCDICDLIHIQLFPGAAIRRERDGDRTRAGSGASAGSMGPRDDPAEDGDPHARGTVAVARIGCAANARRSTNHRRFHSIQQQGNVDGYGNRGTRR